MAKIKTRRPNLKAPRKLISGTKTFGKKVRVSTKKQGTRIRKTIKRQGKSLKEQDSIISTFVFCCPVNFISIEETKFIRNKLNIKYVNILLYFSTIS